jgi:hypothetical protein
VPIILRSRDKVVLVLILLDTYDFIDMWLNTGLIHNIFLKSMEGRLLMINFEKLICTIFFFCINIFPQVATFVRAMDCFPLQGF